MAEALKVLKVQPNEAQKGILFDPTRIKIIGGGERAGKSWTAAEYAYGRHMADTFAQAFHSGKTKETLYWLIGEDYDMCRGEFEHLVTFMDEMDNILEVKTPSQASNILVTKTGARFETKTARDPRKLGVVAPDGVIGCEVGLWTPETWLRSRGRMAEKRAWGIFTGSFEGSGKTFDDYWQVGNKKLNPDIAAFSLPTWTNIAIYPGGRTDPEILSLEAMFPADRFNERFGGIPTRPSGLVLKALSEAFHVDDSVKYDPHYPVQLWVDPGYAHAYAVLAVQLTGDEVRIIDEIYKRGWTHQEMVAEIKKREWFPNVVLTVMDRAGRQNNSNGTSCYNVFKHEFGLTIKTNKVSEKDNIDRINSFLLPSSETGLPLLRISPLAVGLRAEAGSGQKPPNMNSMGEWKYRTHPDGTPSSEAPIDEYNDAAKAFGYGLVHNFGVSIDKRIAPEPSTTRELYRPDKPFVPLLNIEGEPMTNSEAWMQELFDMLPGNDNNNTGLWSS